MSAPSSYSPADWPCIGQQILARADLLADHTESVPTLTRTYLTPAHRACAAQIAQWMREAGMQVRTDAVGNVIGRYEAATPGAPILATGSHYDTVRNAGKYDGLLGILLPIGCIAHWHERGRRFAHALEVIAFAEEEGVRFKATLLGSRACAGTFDMRALDNVDASGTTMRQTIQDAGQAVDDIPRAAYRPGDLAAFVEVHIEQGPVLLHENLPLGVVTAIAGASRFQVELTGLAGHAGTVPMNARRDAAAAAAEIVLFIEQRCSQDGLVGTVGQLNVPDGAVNVIPGKARLSIDIRAGEDALRQAAVGDVLKTMEAICLRRGVTAIVEKTHEAASVPCAAALRRQLAQALRDSGLPVRELPSGAGHDAMAMAEITEVAMLFVRCGNGGISHHPDETMSAGDAALAAQVFARFVEEFTPGG